MPITFGVPKLSQLEAKKREKEARKRTILDLSSLSDEEFSKMYFNIKRPKVQQICRKGEHHYMTEFRQGLLLLINGYGKVIYKEKLEERMSKYWLRIGIFSYPEELELYLSLKEIREFQEDKVKVLRRYFKVASDRFLSSNQTGGFYFN